jgi:hypothetical protein
MSTLPRLVVHVGLAQAGSTTLQRHVFNQIEFGFALLTLNRMETIGKYLELPLAGEFDAQQSAHFFYRRFAEFQDESLVPVISSEGLSDEFLEMEDNFHAEVHARRLREAFGRCKIILIIREQASHLVSKYRKNLETKRRSNVALHAFLRDRPLGQRVQTDSDSVFLPILKHHSLVRLYWELFGRENTLVLPFEMMSQQPANFAKRLNTFCGSRIPPHFAFPRTNVHGARGLSSFYRAYNSVYSPMTISMLWFLNPRRRWGRRWKGHASFVGRTSNSIQKRLVSLLRSARIVTDAKIAREREAQLVKVRRMLGDYFADSNQLLSEMIGIDLAEFGYKTRGQQTHSQNLDLLKKKIPIKIDN